MKQRLVKRLTQTAHTPITITRTLSNPLSTSNRSATLYKLRE